MIEETIRQIEARLQQANLKPETRAELLELVQRLRAEAVNLPPTVAAPPNSTEDAGGVRTLQEDVNSLRATVEEFEGSHPRLVQAVNHLANTLAGLGI